MNESVTTPGLGSYQQAFSGSWTDHTPIAQIRFVVLDTEATGLDVKRNRLISIGAVAVQEGQIVLADSFETMLKIAYNQSAVTVHGITRDEARTGMDEAEALLELLDYLRDGVIVGHHIGFDRDMLNIALERHFGIHLRNRTLDTMDLTLYLQECGGFPGCQEIREFSLDALCQRFGIQPHDRHTAGGDAFLTAQILLRLLNLAKRQGWTRLGDLSNPNCPVETD